MEESSFCFDQYYLRLLSEGARSPEEEKLRSEIVRLTEKNLPYIPFPNRAHLVMTEMESPLEKTPTTAVIVLDRKGVWMARNRRRGREFPGGHVDPGETVIEAATREVVEECGVHVRDIQPLGVKIHFACNNGISQPGKRPEGYHYPWPVSFMQFWVAHVDRVDPFVENGECKMPELVGYDQVQRAIQGMKVPGLRRRYRRALLEEALKFAPVH